MAYIPLHSASRSVSAGPDLQDLRTAQGKKPQMRRYDVAALLLNGDTRQIRQVAPALPLFEDAFCAFARGSLVETQHGPLAIEDILPGDRILTASGHLEPVLWIGTTTVQPGQTTASRRDLRLTRFMADSFGMARPMSDVITGPAARVLHTPEHLRALSAGAQVLTPVQAFQDGVNVIETTPPTPVQLYHICLERHAVIRVGGLEMETYHPGPALLRTASHAMRGLFLNLFPHLGTLSDFGLLAYPRSGDGQADSISAA
ncbi:Hint domain-containing protein [Thalassococcus sp. S3]|uniref:Hint domain-containing protein n=1 Tax=Thalassococcus sp. S3 TaxID=2017482 RepID=UPI0010243ABE|nr:Hint domain-containing protein [Thalassococcus sp. S3]QBF30926.1 hypothetical protein CFI11_06805 [Thalassococcus sp. S3]